jgi:hypothetical protein
MDAEKPPSSSAPRSTGGIFLRALKEAHKRRPTSFYLLLVMPLVLLLGVHIYRYRDNPHAFALVLTLQFVFFGIVFLRAVMDIFEIARRKLREERENYGKTLGDQAFLRELGRRVDAERRKTDGQRKEEPDSGAESGKENGK